MISTIKRRLLRADFFVFWMMLVYVMDSSAIEANDLRSKSPAQQWVTVVVNGDRLKQQIFWSKVTGTNVSYHIYTPEVYDADKKRRFPVIYWLHAHKGGIKWIPKVLEYYSLAMRKGHIPPAIVVFPNGLAESMWVDSKDGKTPMETVITKELIADVDTNFRTIMTSSGRLVEGFSMGGYGAARLGIKYPEIFGAISMLGAGPLQLNFTAEIGPKSKAAARSRILKETYGNDLDYFKKLSPWVLAEKNIDILRGKSIIRIVVGDKDSMLALNRSFSNHLTQLNISHTLQVMPDVRHNALDLFQAMGEGNWHFYQSTLGGSSKTIKADNTIHGSNGEGMPQVYSRSSKDARKPLRQRIIRRLKSFERNNDGYVSIENVNINMRKLFYRIDTNSDEKLSHDEMHFFEVNGVK